MYLVSRVVTSSITLHFVIVVLLDEGWKPGVDLVDDVQEDDVL